MTTPKKTVQIVLEDENPEDVRILTLIAEVRARDPAWAGKTDSDVLNEALRVFVENKRLEARFTAFRHGRPGPNDTDDIDRDDIDPDDMDLDDAAKPEDGLMAKPVRLWLDDLRPAPEGWTHVYTAADAITALSGGGVQEVSLDHDLGEDEGAGTGYDVAVWIETSAAGGTLARIIWAIHSANPVGRSRMRAALESADRLWDRGEGGG